MIYFIDVSNTPCVGNCTHTMYCYDLQTHVETTEQITGQQLVKFCRTYHMSIHTHFMRFAIGASDVALGIPAGQIGDTIYYTQGMYDLAKV